MGNMTLLPKLVKQREFGPCKYWVVPVRDSHNEKIRRVGQAQEKNFEQQWLDQFLRFSTTHSGPRGDLLLIRRGVLTVFKIAINTIHILMTDPDTPIHANTLPTFQKLPPSFKQQLLHTKKKVVYAREPIPSGKVDKTPDGQSPCTHLPGQLIVCGQGNPVVPRYSPQSK
jgi:hypothetical protein